MIAHACLDAPGSLQVCTSQRSWRAWHPCAAVCRSDGADVVLSACRLPELHVGDYVAFPSLGAYSWAGASDFNGFQCRDVRFMHVYSQPCRAELEPPHCPEAWV